jgi:hypothetical protein
MATPFDVTLKDLARDYPADVLTTFDEPPSAPVALLNVDLSTLALATGVVLGVGNPLEEIITIDFQASANATKHNDLLAYNTLLFRHYQVPVHSILVLLRPKGAHSAQTGTIRYESRPGRGKMDFGYEIRRLWERPTAELLSGPLGALPLAPLGQLPEGVDLEAGLSSVIRQMAERILAEAPEHAARRLLTAAFILTGLRVERATARQLFQGVRAMRESDTYLAILDEGRLEEAKKLILQFGSFRLGAPDEATSTFVKGLADLERLERMAARLSEATLSGWPDLLSTR